MKHLFIVNPVAGKLSGAEKCKLIRDGLRDFPEALKKEAEFEIYLTKAPMDAAEKIKAEGASGRELRVYACGGDGTLNECVNGAAEFPNAAVTHFPCGTGNDFIKMFGKADAALFRDLRLLAEGEVRPIDLIDCCGRKAINICSVGIDARIGADVHKYSAIPLIGGPTGYVLSTAVNVFKGISQPMRIEYLGHTLEGEYTLVCACNGRFYGGGFNPIPDAYPDDGVMDCLIADKVSLFTLFGLVGAYSRGRYDKLKQLRRVNVASIAIEGPRDMIVNIDGEIIRSGRAEMRILPGAVNFLFPSGTSFFKDRNM